MGGGKVDLVGTVIIKEIVNMVREMLVVVKAERDVLEADPLAVVNRSLYLSDDEKVTFEEKDFFVGTYVRESTEDGCIEAAIMVPTAIFNAPMYEVIA